MRISVIVGGIVLAVAAAGCGSSSSTALLGSTTTAPSSVSSTIAPSALGSSTTAAVPSTTVAPATTAAPSTTVAPATTASTPTTAAASPTASKYGQDYLTIINPLNTAIDSLISTLKNIPASDTGPQVETAVQPTFTALAKGQAQLAAITWPGKTEAAVQTMIRDIGAVNTDLKAYGTATTEQQGADITTKLNTDITTAGAQSAMIRTDLGLPPAAS